MNHLSQLGIEARMQLDQTLAVQHTTIDTACTCKFQVYVSFRFCYSAIGLWMIWQILSWLEQ